jgi:hypothetical protein
VSRICVTTTYFGKGPTSSQKGFLTAGSDLSKDGGPLPSVCFGGREGEGFVAVLGEDLEVADDGLFPRVANKLLVLGFVVFSTGLLLKLFLVGRVCIRSQKLFFLSLAEALAAVVEAFVVVPSVLGAAFGGSGIFAIVDIRHEYIGLDGS